MHLEMQTLLPQHEAESLERVVSLKVAAEPYTRIRLLVDFVTNWLVPVSPEYSRLGANCR